MCKSEEFKSFVLNLDYAFEKTIKKYYPNIHDSIIKENIDKNIKWNNKLYNYVYNVKDQPKCLHCNSNETKFVNFKVGYRDYCSLKCASIADETTEKKKKTNLKKYGVDSYTKTSEFKNKIKKTIRNKYGVDNAF